MIRPACHLAVLALAAGVAAAAPAGRSKDGAALVARNMFCSTCRAGAPGSDGPPTSLALDLVATHIAAVAADSFATIEDTATQRGGAYAVGQAVPGGGVLVGIGRTFVDVETASGIERLALGARREPAAAPATQPAAPTNIEGLRQVGETSFEIERALVDRVLADPTAFARGVRVGPSTRDGRPDGFKLYSVRPSSPVARLGLRSGDTIHAVNGHELTTMDKVLEVYTKVRESSHLSIAVTRRGQPLSLSYVIK